MLVCINCAPGMLGFINHTQARQHMPAKKLSRGMKKSVDGLILIRLRCGNIERRMKISREREKKLLPRRFPIEAVATTIIRMWSIASLAHLSSISDTPVITKDAGVPGKSISNQSDAAWFQELAFTFCKVLIHTAAYTAHLLDNRFDSTARLLD